MKTRKTVLTILPNKYDGDSWVYQAYNRLYLNDIYSMSEMDGFVVLQSSVFEEVFGITKKLSSSYDKRLPIVKISENGKTIYRVYRSVGVKGFTGQHVGLTSNSIVLLCDINGDNPKEVELSPGKYFPFFWQHPDKAIRISFKLGLLSMALGFLSIITSVVFLFIR